MIHEDFTLCSELPLAAGPGANLAPAGLPQFPEQDQAGASEVPSRPLCCGKAEVGPKTVPISGLAIKFKRSNIFQFAFFSCTQIEAISMPHFAYSSIPDSVFILHVCVHCARMYQVAIPS